jgi:hypothetical protein
MHSRPELARVTTGAFSAVSGTWGEASVAFTADLLVAVVFGGKGLQRRFDDAATETEDKMECRLLQKAKEPMLRQQNRINTNSTCLLDIVVREGPAVLKLLAGEDETLLVRRNAVTQKKLQKIRACVHVSSCSNEE